MDPSILAFLGAFAGGAVAGLASSAGRWRKVDERLLRVATEAAEAAVLRHADACTLRAVATKHLADEGAVQLTPSGRYPLQPILR